MLQTQKCSFAENRWVSGAMQRWHDPKCVVARLNIVEPRNWYLLGFECTGHRRISTTALDNIIYINGMVAAIDTMLMKTRKLRPTGENEAFYFLNLPTEKQPFPLSTQTKGEWNENKIRKMNDNSKCHKRDETKQLNKVVKVWTKWIYRSMRYMNGMRSLSLSHTHSVFLTILSTLLNVHVTDVPTNARASENGEWRMETHEPRTNIHPFDASMHLMCCAIQLFSNDGKHFLLCLLLMPKMPKRNSLLSFAPNNKIK